MKNYFLFYCFLPAQTSVFQPGSDCDEVILVEPDKVVIVGAEF